MRKTKTLLGPLKTKEAVSFSVDFNVNRDVQKLLSEKGLKLSVVLDEFMRRLAMQDPRAMEFITHANARVIPKKSKDDPVFEFSREIDVDALYNLIEQQES